MMKRYVLKHGDINSCECSDPGCPHCDGQCDNKATKIVTSYNELWAACGECGDYRYRCYDVCIQTIPRKDV